jgi:hypothetical protein
MSTEDQVAPVEALAPADPSAEGDAPTITYGQLVKDLAAQLQPPQKLKPIGAPGKPTATGAVAPPPFTVPADFHPDVVKHIAGDAYEDLRSVLGETETALSAASQALSDIHKAYLDTGRRPKITEEDRIDRVAPAAFETQQKVARKIDAARANLVTSAEALDRQLSTAINGSSLGGVAAEIRAHVRGMSDPKRPGERLAFVQNAIRDGDTVTVRAVLGSDAPAYLSGIDPKMRDALVRVWNEKASPQITTRLDVQRKVIAMLDARGASFLTLVPKAFNSDWTTVAKIREVNKMSDDSIAKLKG